jgi:hypothetical protein
MWDFVFEFIDGEWEGEQVLCETESEQAAFRTMYDVWGFDPDELKFVKKISVEEGEALGLDTY